LIVGLVVCAENPNIEPLSWDIRLKIAVGAARGLTFLHTSDKKVIYRDFKASNILLDGVSLFIMIHIFSIWGLIFLWYSLFVVERTNKVESSKKYDSALCDSKFLINSALSLLKCDWQYGGKECHCVSLSLSSFHFLSYH